MKDLYECVCLTVDTDNELDTAHSPLDDIVLDTVGRSLKGEATTMAMGLGPHETLHDLFKNLLLHDQHIRLRGSSFRC